jgi:methionyl-tRNA synthetase
LQEWYRIVQKANEYITKAEPWKKWKEDSTKEEAIKDLQLLLYVIKNLTILSSPILTNGFEKLKSIL